MTIRVRNYGFTEASGDYRRKGYLINVPALTIVEYDIQLPEDRWLKGATGVVIGLPDETNIPYVEFGVVGTHPIYGEVVVWYAETEYLYVGYHENISSTTIKKITADMKIRVRINNENGNTAFKFIITPDWRANIPEGYIYGN